MNAGPRIHPLCATVLSLILATVLLLTSLSLCAVSAETAVPLPDYNEPNDSFPQATALSSGITGHGAITTASDKDYFYLDLAASSKVTVTFVSGVPLRQCTLAFKASGGDVVADLDWEKQYDDDGSFLASGTVGPGRLFAVIGIGGAASSTAGYMITLTVSGPGGGTTFPDVAQGSPYFAAITSLAGAGVVSGYSNGNFGPSDPVTRQQFAKMIVRATGYSVSQDDACPFSDVQTSAPGHYLDANDPLYPDHYIAVAARHGITKGQTPTIFRPDHNITMAQVVTMVVRTAEDKAVWDSPPASYEPPFADFGQPHYGYAREGAAHGLFTGYNGPWDWTSPATRGQCAFFVWKLMTALGGGEGEPID